MNLLELSIWWAGCPLYEGRGRLEARAQLSPELGPGTHRVLAEVRVEQAVLPPLKPVSRNPWVLLAEIA